MAKFCCVVSQISSSLVCGDDVDASVFFEGVDDPKHEFALLTATLSTDFGNGGSPCLSVILLGRNRLDNDLCAEDFMLGVYHCTLRCAFDLLFDFVLLKPRVIALCLKDDIDERYAVILGS